MSGAVKAREKEFALFDQAAAVSCVADYYFTFDSSAGLQNISERQEVNRMSDLISVIVPIYKVEEYLDECVQSIVSQTYRNLEIILVDDGSPDNCPQMCDAWASKDSRIKVIHKENGGLSDARNAGLDIAKGDYIAFVDSDDWIAPEMYEVMLSAINKEKADICSCKILSCYPGSEVEVGAAEYTVGNSEEILSMIYNDTVYPVAAYNKLYRKSCWSKLRFPVGKICEDAFTTYLLVDGADKIVHLPEPFYYYRIRPNSIMTASFSRKRMDEEEAWRCNYQYMELHYPLLKDAAFDFYLQKVYILLGAIQKEQRADFSEEYQYLHGILRKNIRYLLFGSKLYWKKRVKLLLGFFTL